MAEQTDSIKPPIADVVKLAKECRELYNKHANLAKEQNEATGGWRFDNDYRNNDNNNKPGKNAAICIELQYAICEITGVVSLFKASLSKFDGHIRQHWTTANFHYNKAIEKINV